MCVEDREFFALADVINVVFVKKCLMFFLNCKTVIFFYPKASVANNHDEIPYQPVLWRIFTSTLNKRNERFRIEIAKSIPNTGLVLDYGQTR